MTKNELSFEDWVDDLNLLLFDKGIQKETDLVSLKEDYDKGKDYLDVFDDIYCEYADDI